MFGGVFLSLLRGGGVGWGLGGGRDQEEEEADGEEEGEEEGDWAGASHGADCHDVSETWCSRVEGVKGVEE